MKSHITTALLIGACLVMSCDTKNQKDEPSKAEAEHPAVVGVWKTAFRERMELTPHRDVYIWEVSNSGEEKLRRRGRYRDNGSVLSIKLDPLNAVDTEPGPWEKKHYRIIDDPQLGKLLEFYDPARPRMITTKAEFVRASDH